MVAHRYTCSRRRTPALRPSFATVTLSTPAPSMQQTGERGAVADVVVLRKPMFSVPAVDPPPPLLVTVPAPTSAPMVTVCRRQPH